MKIRAKNTVIDPVYWAHLRKWPFGQVVEYDVSAHELADIKADARIQIVDDEVVPTMAPLPIDDEPEKRGPGRPKKGK